MKKLLYLIRSLGIYKCILYIFLYPMKYVEKYHRWAHTVRVEKRSHSIIYNYKTRSSQAKNSLSKKRKREIKSYYKQFGLSINPEWHEFFYFYSGLDSHRYISEYLFYQYIEPYFNDRRMAHSFSDKNQYNKIFSIVLQPKTIARYIRSEFYDDSYQQLDQKEIIEKILHLNEPVIIKPSVQSGAGRNVNILKSNSGSIFLNDKNISFKNLLNLYRSGFIIQEKITQHKRLNAVYPHSLNTIKLTSFRYQNKIKIISKLFRAGNNGHYLDNMNEGGFCCGIGADGTLNDLAYHKTLEKYSEHPFTNTSFGNITIPNFMELKDKVKKLHQENLFCDIASWDFGINIDGAPVLIETNLKSQGILFQQLVKGPLFEDMTDEVLQEVFSNR